MKKILLLLCLACCGMAAAAQDGAGKTGNDSTRASQGVFYKEIPKRLNIKDKVFLVNRTPFWIVQAMVAVVDDRDGSLTPLGSAALVAPNESWELASFSDNNLKYLRGKRLAIKVKGSRKMLAASRTDVSTPYGSVGVQRRNIDQETLNSLQPEDFVYDFGAVLYEANHDLYIRIVNMGDNGIMDF